MRNLEGLCTTRYRVLPFVVFGRTLIKFAVLPVYLIGQAAAESWVREMNERFGPSVEVPSTFKNRRHSR